MIDGLLLLYWTGTLSRFSHLPILDVLPDAPPFTLGFVPPHEINPSFIIYNKEY